mmetsp:Transcript_26068/g.72742  ORF Transcript_26068/g.72742 Transcript_26068/m.72742 type:complete len:211 (-) Transcript_26068:205-837(-)
MIVHGGACDGDRDGWIVWGGFSSTTTPFLSFLCGGAAQGTREELVDAFLGFLFGHRTRISCLPIVLLGGVHFLVEFANGFDGFQQQRFGQLFSFLGGHCQTHAKAILDLATIQLSICELVGIEVCITCVRQWRWLVTCTGSSARSRCLVLNGVPTFFQQILPNLSTTWALEVVVTEGQCDPRLERRIQRIDAVGRQEQDALEVLHKTQHD